MRNAVRCLLLGGILCLTAAAEEIVLRAGTLVECTLSEPGFSSQTARIGDPLRCHLGPLREFGRPVFPRGSYLVGRFCDWREPGRLAGKGWLKLEFDRIILPAAEVSVATKIVSVPLFRVDGEGRIHGRGHPRRDAIGWLLPPLWPVKLIALPMRGPRPMLKGEIPVMLRLLEDVTLPSEKERRLPEGH